jgi:hypothetical protein
MGICRDLIMPYDVVEMDPSASGVPRRSASACRTDGVVPRVRGDRNVGVSGRVRSRPRPLSLDR